MIDTNSRIFIIHTSWYKDYIDRMVDISIDVIKNKKLNGIVLNTRSYKAPGALELAALGAQKVGYDSDSVGVIFHGIIIRGETSHYDLVTQETFRSIGNLLMITLIGLLLTTSYVLKTKISLRKDLKEIQKRILKL